jgi:hypothetical protein
MGWFGKSFACAKAKLLDATPPNRAADETRNSRRLIILLPPTSAPNFRIAKNFSICSMVMHARHPSQEK